LRGKSGREVGFAACVWRNPLSGNPAIDQPGHRGGVGLGDFGVAACGSGAGPDCLDVQVAIAILRYCDVHPVSPPKQFLRRLYRQAGHYREVGRLGLLILFAFFSLMRAGNAHVVASGGIEANIAVLKMYLS
jgi:hypothetical protein